MTYNMAYGDDYFGLIPKESPIAWFFTVDAVDPVERGRCGTGELKVE